MYERGVIVTYVVAYDDPLVQAKLHLSYTELIGKYPMFWFPSVKGRNINDARNIDFNIPEPYFVADPTR